MGRERHPGPAPASLKVRAAGTQARGIRGAIVKGSLPVMKSAPRRFNSRSLAGDQLRSVAPCRTGVPCLAVTHWLAMVRVATHCDTELMSDLVQLIETSGAPRSMKMGTIRSPCSYDAAARHALPSAKLRRPAISRYASWRLSSRCRRVVRIMRISLSEPPANAGLGDMNSEVASIFAKRTVFENDTIQASALVALDNPYDLWLFWSHPGTPDYNLAREREPS